MAINPRNVTAQPAPGTAAGARTDLLSELRFMFPWFDQIGLSPQWFQELAATAATPDEVVLKLRQEPLYRKRFPALFREDGSLRMSEGEYLNRENEYRQLLRQYGIPEQEFSTPGSLAGIFESEQDPNELQERLKTWATIRDSSQNVRETFYVYAGLDISVDDLFEATVNKEYAAELTNAYRERVAQGFDYQTFLTRAAKVAGDRVAQLVSMNDNVVTIQNIPKDPAFAMKVLDVLYSTPGADQSPTLSLQELLASYEEAVIGAAALGAGLGIPTKERVAQIRAAGIERARAVQAYQEFGRQAGALNAAGLRTGAGPIDRTTFENAAFFGDVNSTRALELAAASERAAGQSGGSFRFDQDRQGNLFQRGLVA